MDIPLLVLIVIVTALAFDFTNGFHDTANAMATSIATGALKPKVAVIVAAVLNLVGAFLSTEVAKTISGGLVDDTKITTAVIFGGLTGAIVWNMWTWLLGIPSSSSMALFGGLIGAVWIGSGASAVHFGAVISKVLIPAFASPVVAALVAAAATYLAYRIVRSAHGPSVSRGFRVGQTVSASMVALAHGTSDGQKTMGVITLTLIAAGQLHPGSGPPLWVVFSAGTAIAIGTYLGGWRIIQTMGHKLVRIEAPQGFSAETTSTVVLLVSSHAGFPLSTTQVCAGSILGAGLGKDRQSVRWNVAWRMLLTWCFTLPAAGIVGGIAARIANTGNTGVLVVAAVLIGTVTAIYLINRRNAVTAATVNEVPAEPAVPATVA
ncbi:phosphate transporter [Mycobacteroides chelonae]|uniref:Phosphate transporter n=1 Tax=Mycobacteroides chelonae TaxID=1774 RepID=A0A1S1LXT6_MYCCH|nr:inorganic phosphate transporter [Mycobacteroides chelonae]PKQ57547.1 phosphate transporter [Mycobacterium sp. MHSD3]SKL33920.1 Low-affinity inorganic phosphate transporter PitA [Mycobacteroides abscessus subsp. bolletii]MBF9523949.1 inorganic phosphate transporter [Mycobacteroides chelonae]OHU57270.1 phosphate transporter [Mycobacteroides chelonae]OHU76002.1 phosphate transporter [Mycobacteroides chelonae]